MSESSPMAKFCRHSWGLVVAVSAAFIMPMIAAAPASAATPTTGCSASAVTVAVDSFDKTVLDVSLASSGCPDGVYGHAGEEKGAETSFNDNFSLYGGDTRPLLDGFCTYRVNVVDQKTNVVLVDGTYRVDANCAAPTTVKSTTPAPTTVKSTTPAPTTVKSTTPAPTTVKSTLPTLITTLSSTSAGPTCTKTPDWSLLKHSLLRVGNTFIYTVSYTGTEPLCAGYGIPVSENLYLTQGVDFEHSGIQSLMIHLTGYITPTNLVVSHSESLTDGTCYYQVDGFLDAHAYDGKDGALPHYPDSYTPPVDILTDHSNGGSKDCTKKPKPPVETSSTQGSSSSTASSNPSSSTTIIVPSTTVPSTNTPVTVTTTTSGTTSTSSKPPVVTLPVTVTVTPTTIIQITTATSNSVTTVVKTTTDRATGTTAIVVVTSSATVYSSAPARTIEYGGVPGGEYLISVAPKFVVYVHAGKFAAIQLPAVNVPGRSSGLSLVVLTFLLGLAIVFVLTRGIMKRRQNGVVGGAHI
jgi:hypothetical protein